MLVFTSRSDETPEESVFDLFLSAEAERSDPASPWFGHPFRVRTAMRDGSTITLAFTLSESAEVLALLSDDQTVRTWLDMKQSTANTSRKLN